MGKKYLRNLVNSEFQVISLRKSEFYCISDAEDTEERRKNAAINAVLQWRWKISGGCCRSKRQKFNGWMMRNLCGYHTTMFFSQETYTRMVCICIIIGEAHSLPRKVRCYTTNKAIMKIIDYRIVTLISYLEKQKSEELQSINRRSVH